MVTIIKHNVYRSKGGGDYGQGAVYTCFGKEADTKPTENMTNGSVFIEMDTAKAYGFDEETREWLEIGSAQVVV